MMGECPLAIWRSSQNNWRKWRADSETSTKNMDIFLFSFLLCELFGTQRNFILTQFFCHLYSSIHVNIKCVVSPMKQCCREQQRYSLIPCLPSLLTFFIFLFYSLPTACFWIFFISLSCPSVAHPSLSDCLQQCEQKIKHSPSVHMIPGQYVYV